MKEINLILVILAFRFSLLLFICIDVYYIAYLIYYILFGNKKK